MPPAAPALPSSPTAGAECAYWSRPAAELIGQLQTTATGLSSDQARERLARQGDNSLGRSAAVSPWRLFARQFYSPLVLILIFAAVVSAFVGEDQEAAIIGAIVLASCILSFSQEYSASRAMEALKQRISTKASVLRDGRPVSIPSDQIVPGDVLTLSAGSLIPADGIILEARDFNVSEAALTGETFPVVKSPGQVAPEAGLALRSNAVFAGTSVRSGTATVLVVKTGKHTVSVFPWRARWRWRARRPT